MTLQLLAAIILLCAWLALAWYMRRRARLQRSPATPGKAEIAVIYASQTGTAQDLAQRTVEALGPDRAALISMEQLNPEHLLGYKTALFIVSTYGEGDPPDTAQAFYKQANAWTPGGTTLAGLETAVLALGDSSYLNYCGFGQTLSRWLALQGTTALFDTILADKSSHTALRAWRDQLSKQFQVRLDIDEHYADWRLTKRLHLNPGSLGGACYELSLEPAYTEGLGWCAGDIAEIQIGQGEAHRDYSIASTATEGALRLLVRQHIQENGEVGIGSHWLTHRLQEGETLPLRIRPNPLFHIPDDARPAIFIGNGTGIAGLRALLQARIELGHYENWLIFGERQQSLDFYYADELNQQHAQQKIKRLDLAFSRDQADKRYVHHCLSEAAPMLKDWVARGAVIYVCGSKGGMAHDVDQALQDILGAFGYNALLQMRHYRRDVY